MKSAAWVLGLVSLCLGLAGRPRQVANETPWTIVLVGDLKGTISPCGCTSPMAGGIVRRGSVLRSFAGEPHTVVLDSGNWTVGKGAQDRMKAESVADSLSGLHVDAVLRTSSFSAFGPATESNLQTLVGAPFVGTDMPPVEKGPFQIYGWTGPPDVEAAAARKASESDGQSVVWMTSSDEARALEVAKAAPRLRLVVYRSVGTPGMPYQAGDVWLATPGDGGKAVVSLNFKGRVLTGSSSKLLSTDVPDDPDSLEVFKSYQSRVEKAKLVESLPRHPGDEFVGSASCLSCHAGSFHVWKGSAHSGALKTLEEKGSARDPECLPCHVTGLSSTSGFRDPTSTPDLAGVGCESCHTAGKRHAFAPLDVKLSPVSQTTCLSCHDSDHSPGFDPLKAWQKVGHGGTFPPLVDKRQYPGKEFNP